MATCKDCLHIDVCYMVEHYGVDIEEDRQEYDCHQFQAKTNCVEVVRCKDCKYYHTHNRSVKWNTEAVYCCKSALKKVCPDDFCSSGERRDGE